MFFECKWYVVCCETRCRSREKTVPKLIEHGAKDNKNTAPKLIEDGAKDNKNTARKLENTLRKLREYAAKA